jgi:hypothetical protein
MVSTMPDARLEVRGAGHLPWLDAPEECASVVGDFLSRPGSARRGSFAAAAQTANEVSPCAR